MGTTFNDPVVFTDTATFSGITQFLNTVSIPAESITNSSIIASAEISEDKVRHRHSKEYIQAPGTDVVTATTYIHLCRAAGDLHSVRVRPLTAPTGGDKQFTVDVKKAANGSGSFATLLASVITVNSSSTSQTQQSGTLAADPSLAAGDLIQIVVTASGSTGSQGQGVVIELQINESAL